MKRFILSAVIFLAAFVISYMGLCYLVPGLRIKLAADAATYFRESIRHMVLLKSIISFVIGSVFATIPLLAAKRKE
jgi:hypothetical protein